MYKFEPGECSVAVVWGGVGSAGMGYTVKDMPCYPEEASESVSASWQSQQVIGRVGNLYAYTGTGDASVSFTFDLHRELIEPTGTSIDELIKLIKSGCYPSYSGGVKPPRTMWKFGDMQISGILQSVGTVWKTPIINKAYAVCSVSIQMTAVHRSIIDKSDVLSSLPVRGGAGSGEMG